MSNKIILAYQDKKMGENLKFLIENEFNFKVIAMFQSSNDYERALKDISHILEDTKLILFTGEKDFCQTIFNLTVDKFHNEKAFWHIGSNELEGYSGFKPLFIHTENWFIKLRENIKKNFKRESTIPVKDFIPITADVMKEIIEANDILHIFKEEEDGGYTISNDVFLLMKNKTFKLFKKEDGFVHDDRERILEKIKISEQNKIKLLFAIKRKTFNYIIQQTQKYEKALDSKVNKEALNKITKLKKDLDSERTHSLGEHSRRLHQKANLGQQIMEQAETQLLLQEEYKQNKETIDGYIKKSGNIQNEIKKMKSMDLKSFLKNSLKIKEIISKTSKKSEAIFNSRAELVARTACFLAIKKGFNFAGDKLTKSSFLCDMMLRGRPELFFIRTKNDLNEAINKYNLTEAEIELVESHAFLTSKMIHKFYGGIAQTKNTLDEDYFKITEQHHYIPDEEYLGIMIEKLKKHQVKALSVVFIVAQEFADFVYKETLKGSKNINYDGIFTILKSRYGKGLEFMNTIKVLEEAYRKKK